MKRNFRILKYFNRIIFALGLFFLTTTSAHAEDPSITVKAELDNAFITIGDQVIYTVSIRHLPSIKILEVPRLRSSQNLKIKKAKRFKVEEDGYVVEGYRATITTFQLGEFLLNPITIQYRDQDGNIKSLATKQLYLTVKSVAEGEQQTDIRGIKSVIDREESLPPWVWLLIGLILVGTASYIFYGIYKKKQKEPIQVINPLTAEEEALMKLNALFDSDLLKSGMIKEYFLELSEVLRNYFDSVIGIDTIEKTTDEIIKSLKAENLDNTSINLIKEVLEFADLAKFAKWNPDPTEILGINKKSKEIIEKVSKQTQKVDDGV